jgi:hypothetical protein
MSHIGICGPVWESSFLWDIPSNFTKQTYKLLECCQQTSVETLSFATLVGSGPSFNTSLSRESSNIFSQIPLSHIHKVHGVFQSDVPRDSYKMGKVANVILRRRGNKTRAGGCLSPHNTHMCLYLVVACGGHSMA